MALKKHYNISPLLVTNIHSLPSRLEQIFNQQLSNATNMNIYGISDMNMTNNFILSLHIKQTTVYWNDAEMRKLQKD